MERKIADMLIKEIPEILRYSGVHDITAEK